MRKKVIISCELVVSVWDESDIKEVVKSIKEESKNCFGVGAGNFSYDIEKFQKLKVIK